MFRFLALVFAVLGLGFLALDLRPVLGQGAALRFAALGDWWAWASPDSLLGLQSAIERHLSPLLWDPGMQTLLQGPVFAETLGLGLLFWLLRRRRRPPKGRARDNLTFRRR